MNHRGAISVRAAGPRRQHRLDDRGSMVPFVAIVLLGFVLAVGIIGITTRHYVRSARAQWAADAAALAVAALGPADGGIEAARMVAEANGGRLVSVSLGGPSGSESPRAAISHSGRNPQMERSTGVGSVVVVEVDYYGIGATAAAQRLTMRTP